MMAEEAQLEPKLLFQVEVHKMGGELLDALDPILEKAFRAGADEVELFAQSRREKAINIESNSLKSATSTIVDGVGIRVLINKCIGFTSVNSLASERIEEGIATAVSIAKGTPSIDHYSLPNPQPISRVKGLHDKNLEDLSMDEVLEYAADVLSAVRAFDERISVDSTNLGANAVESAILSSNGIRSSEKKTFLQIFLFGMAVDGDDIGSFDYVLEAFPSKKKVDIEATVTGFGERVVRNLGAKKAEALAGPTILSPDCLVELLNAFVLAACASRIQDGASYLADRLGEQIAVPSLSIIDDGSKESETGSASFDREGIPHRPHKIIDKGVFKGILYDAFTANKESLQSTGHARGTFRQAPTISSTNIEIPAGSVSVDEMLGGIRKGILIPRISAFPDPVSGVFAGPVKGGQLIEDGELRHTLKEIQVTGNVFELLKNITAISKERLATRYDNQTYLLPYVQVEGMSYSV